MFKVEYEVYYPFSPNNFTKLNLSICSGIKIDINIPISISPDEIDKYNISSRLYNDICYSYTSDKGTDKTLKDRQEEFKKRNISVCEENCDFTGYDNKTKKAVCSCFTKIELPIVSAIKVDKKQLFSNFKNIKNVANFQMLKCIYLIFNLKNIFKNTANYMMLFLYTFSKIALFVFMCYNNNKIKEYIKQFSLNKKKGINNNNITDINNKKKEENKIMGKSSILTLEKNESNSLKNMLNNNNKIVNLNLNAVNNNKLIIDKNAKSSQRRLKGKNNNKNIKQKTKSKSNNKKTKQITVENKGKIKNNLIKKNLSSKIEKQKFKNNNIIIENNITYNDA